MIRRSLVHNLILAKGKGLILFPLVTVVVFCCDPPGDNRLWIYNQSIDTLYYYKSYGEPLPDKQPFSQFDYMLPGDSVNLVLGTGSLKLRIEAGPDSSLTIFTFPKGVIQGKDWPTIMNTKLYHKSVFHIKEVEQSHWHVEVPKKQANL